MHMIIDYSIITAFMAVGCKNWSGQAALAVMMDAALDLDRVD